MRGIERFYVYQAEPVTEVKLLLFEQRVASGADAAYQGAAPTRPREGNMLYTFTGWDKSLTGITADLHSCDTFRDFSDSEPPWAYRWDFDNTWVIDKKQNGGFPTLQFKNTRLDLTVTDTLHRPDVNLLEIELDLSKWVKGDLVFAGHRNGKLTCVDTTYKYTESGQFFGGGWHKFYYEGEAPEMVKVMVWKGVGTMMPLCEIAEIKMSAVPVATE